MLDFGPMRSGGGGAAGRGRATALRPQLLRARLAASPPELSLAEEWTDFDTEAERC